MTHEIIAAGFGGQGVLLLGKILSYAAILDGKETTWISSYGVEMRGGTANCSVIISDRAIGSPFVYEPTAAAVLNAPSFEKFEPHVAAGGVLIINSSLIELRSSRAEIRSYLVPCTDIAVELGNARGTNMVALGALLAATSAVSMSAVTEAITKSFAGKSVSAGSLEQLVLRGFDAVSKYAGAAKATLVTA